MTRLDWVGIQLNQFTESILPKEKKHLASYQSAINQDYQNMIEYRIVMRNKSSEWLEYIELGFDSISLKCLKDMKTVYQDENSVVLDENIVE